MKVSKECMLVSKEVLLRFVAGSFLTLVFSCAGNTPVPPPTFFEVRATFKSTKGQDLLNPSNPNSFKQSDISVFSRIDFNRIVKDVYYNNDDKGIGVYFDNELQSYYFDLTVPSNDVKNPIATIVTLSKSDTDTVTYSFGSARNKGIPEKIYYNKIQVWDIVNLPREGKFPPINVIK